MALKKPSDFFVKKVVEHNNLPISEDDNSLRDELNKVESLSEQLQQLQQELTQKVIRNDLESLVLSQINLMQENFETLQNQLNETNDINLYNFKQVISNITQIVNNLVENEIPKQKKEILSNEVRLGNQLKEFKEEVEDKVQKFYQVLNEFNEVVQVIDTVSNIEKYLQEHHQDLITLREEVFAEIEQIPVGDLQENLERLEKKLDYIKETYSKIEPEVLVKEVIKEGLLNEPSETKNEDPLTPLNQNFVTLDQLQEHYRLFINRIQQQLATIGGGGETRLKYLDDIVGIATNPSAYNGKFLKYDHSIGKFVFATAGGGAGSQTLDDTLQLGNTSSLGMSVGDVTASSFIKSGGTSTQFLKADGSVDTATYATQTYVGLSTVGLASVSYVNNQVGLATSGLASQTYVGLATVGLASVSYVNNQVGLATSGLASQTYVGLATAGLLSSTGNGSNLIGIVTYIEGGSGILVDQNTGKVTITSLGGGGGAVGLTIKDEGSTVGTAGSVFSINFVGDNVTATASGTASTITVATQTYVATAGVATYASTAGIATYANTAGIATYATTAGVSTIAGYASTAGIATVAQNLTGSPNITVSSVNSSGIVTASSFSGSGSNLTGIVTYITAGSGISVNQNTGNVTITNVGAALTGNNVFTGINTFTGSNTFSGSIIIEQASEAFNKYSTTINAAAVINLDCSTGNIHYITSTVNGNWTANLTNVGITSGYCANYTLVINQGTTAYIPNALQIAGVTTSINWQGGSIPTGNNNKKDVIAYTVFDDAGAYTVFGQLVTFG